MASKLKQVNDITSGGGTDRNSNFVNMLLNIDGETDGRTVFNEIPLEEITPRSVNKFRQSRIDKLAKSIRNTNNRLIHPITVVRAADLPKDSEVLQAYEKKGIDISSLKYIIVSGERRYRAFLQLREEEEIAVNEKYDKGILSASNPFKTITANILTPAEAENENVFYEDSNIEARQLTPIEAILHIKDAISEITSPEEMRVALIEMNGGSDDGIPKSDVEIKKRFRMDKYCAYCLETDLGIEGVSESTIRNHLAILNNCPESIVDALIDGSYTIREAKSITKYPKDVQEELLNLWRKDKELYAKKIEELKSPSVAGKKRYTRIDAKKRLKSYSEKNEKEMNELKDIAKKLGEYDKEILDQGIAEIEEHVQIINEIVSKTISYLK